MTLLEMLKEKLKAWPADAAAITQDAGCGTYGWTGPTDRLYLYAGTSWYGGGDIVGLEPHFEQAEDFAVAIVTRDMWDGAFEPESLLSLAGDIFNGEPLPNIENIPPLDFGPEPDTSPAQAMRRLQEITATLRELLQERADICAQFQIDLP